MSRADSIVLLASAGTGKTFQLTNRLLALYASDVRPQRVLASTFTRKAAGEILERLITRLCKACVSEEECAVLAEAIGVDIDRANAIELCVQLLRNIDRLRISTLDAWFKERVQRSSLVLGLPADWDVSDPQMERRLCGRALSRALDRPRSDSEWSTLISDLKRGGAESRVHQGLLTSLSQAARLARECTEGAWDFPPAVADLSEAQFVDALAALQRAEIPLTKAGKPRKQYESAVAKLLKLLAAHDWHGFAGETLVCHVLDGSGSYSSCAIPDDMSAQIVLLSQRAAHHLTNLVRAQNRALRVLVADFIEELDAATLQERRLSFDALPRLLEASPYLGKGSDDVEHLLLDEFQDTSGLQWRALESSVRSTLEREDASFFCVGDVKQSIYAWRNGNPLLLAELAERLQLPQGTLAENRRSAEVLLDFVNLVFERIDENQALADPAGELATKRFQSVYERHFTQRKLEGHVRLWTGPEIADSRLVKPREDARLERGVALALELRRRQPDWSIAFLVRKKKLVPSLLERLKRVGMSASGEGGNPLTDSSAVNAALSLLEFADHPSDDFLCFHLATSPLAEHAGIAWNADVQARAEASRNLRHSWNELGAAKFLAQLERTVQEHYSAFDQRRFAQLIALAQRLEPSDPLRPAHFAERLSLERVPDVASAAIQVMTVHGAKGLQFDAVILIDCDGALGKAERGVIAQRRDADPRAPADIVTHTLGTKEALVHPELRDVQVAAKGARLLEELCVLYVALTRAVHAIEIVIDYPKDNLKKSSFAGILLQSLGIEEPKPDSLIWFDPLEQPRTVPSVMRKPAQPVERETPARSQLLAKRAATAHVRPSQVAHELNSSRSTAELFFSNEAARSRGRLWHGWLERIAWSEDGSPSPAQLAEWARESGWREFDPRQTELFLRALAQPRMHAELSREQAAQRLGGSAGDLVLLREHSFCFLRDGEQGRELVQGVFDRAVISRSTRRAEIIDYKTEQLAGDDPRAEHEAAEHYRPQMQLYGSALALLEGLDEQHIDLRVCFVG